METVFFVCPIKLCYNVNMKRLVRKVKEKVFSKKTKVKFDTESNVIFEDNSSKNSKLKMIFDKDEPFYKHTYPKEEE